MTLDSAAEDLNFILNFNLKHFTFTIDTKEFYWFKAKFYWLKWIFFILFEERHKKNLQTHRDGCHFSFFIHIFSLSRDAFAENFFPLLLTFPSLCAHLCVFVRLRKNKMNIRRKNRKHAAKQFYRFFCLILSSFVLSGRLRIDDADDDNEKSSSRNFQLLLVFGDKKRYRDTPTCNICTWF